MKDLLLNARVVPRTSNWKFHIVIWQTTSKNCNKKRAARAAQLFFSSFNQSNHWFVALSLPLPSSFLKLPTIEDVKKRLRHNMIGWMRKYNRAARAAHFLLQFLTKSSKRRREILNLRFILQRQRTRSSNLSFFYLYTKEFPFVPRTWSTWNYLKTLNLMQKFPLQQSSNLLKSYFHCYTSQTQIRFLIGEERVTCQWSKLHDALGKQQLELSTRTWSDRALLKPRQICLRAASSK